MNRSFCLGAFLCAMLLAVGRPAQAEYTFTTIDYPDAAASLALGIGNAGQILGEYHDFSGVIHAFVLSDGVFEPFDYPGSLGTSALSINASGNVVGVYGDYFTGNTRAFLRNGDTYTDLEPSASSTYTGANSINDAGHIVGSYYTNNVNRGYLFDGTMYTTLNRPSAQHTVALGINNAESIVGNYVAAGLRHGFRLTGVTYTTLDVPGAALTVAQGINDSGQIAGLYQDFSGTFHGFVRNDGTYVTVDVPGATLTQIKGINNAGHVAGYFEDATGTHGFLATPMLEGDFNLDRTVDAADYTVWRDNLGAADDSSINNNGDGVAGVTAADYAVWKSNFGATLGFGSGAALPSAAPLSPAVPEPSNLALAAVGLLGLIAAARNRRRVTSLTPTPLASTPESPPAQSDGPR